MTTDRRRLSIEVALVLTVTFGMSGVRATLKLIDAALAPAPLNQQRTVLNDAASSLSWLDIALQLASAATLLAWGGLALFLLGERLPCPRWRDWAWSAGLAALIGIPGLALYVVSLQLGLTKEVVPATDAAKVPLLLVWSAANAFAEETVVVMWLLTRLKQLRAPVWGAIAASAVLRGTYHLYQGFSAGVGNVVMGIVFAYYYHRTGKVWPLILAHFLIDAVAYVGYLFLDLSWLGL
ncbi:CPBP family intramembrane metalloprotease [Corynebacterium sp. P3-F1]|uniref:CPBP family intramembrane glutamic endopeptidase n=1 Tax=Corynebacterium sp. P3-F1 TaxID=3059080 RepID=UPI00265D50D4|nr:CPBP family intramembrane glutamic endopeptidase [Corynebacterium sp. P3-F1]WKK60523.1 CPBP family intramembrane metalloprotease [Corynebacterium sp. P3-F1]